MQDPYWEPGTQYSYGDVVQYEGHRYKIIQPHRSQGDWTPPVTPALWGKLSDYDRGGDCQPQQQQPQYGYQQPTPPQYGGQQGYSDDKAEQSQAPEPVPEKHWYGDEENKKKLEIGAGVLGAGALLAGGILAYKKHEQHKEEGKSRVWAQSNWIEEARARSEAFYQRGPTGPATWILVQGKKIPNGAIVVGQEHGKNLYSSRAYYKSAMVVGKASEHFHKGGNIGYGDEEIEIDEYEVLVGDMHHLRWVATSGHLNVESLGYRPVEGGHEADGTPVYIARAPYKDATHPGKASAKLEGAYITYGGKEKCVKEYQVLCYN